MLFLSAKANIKKLYPYAFLKKDLPTDLSIGGEGSYFSINSLSIFSLVNFSLPVELSSYFVSIMKSSNCNNSVRCSFLINLKIGRASCRERVYISELECRLVHK